MVNETINETKEYIVGIDIGSSTVKVSVGEKQKDGSLSVKGVEIQSVNDSVKDGSIEQIMELGKAIDAAKSALEKELNLTLKDAYVGISGAAVSGALYEDFVYINSANNLITESDVRDLTERINKVTTHNNDVIIERILQRYIISDKQEVRNPVGAFGTKLSAEYLLVFCNKVQIERIKQALFHAKLQYKGVCVNHIAQPLALLSKEEQDEGVAIVDIGCDLTDISVVRKGRVCFFASLPIGASSINFDLAQFVSASKSNIEKLKKFYGEAIAENISLDETCSVEVLGHSRKQILKRNVVEIIEERLKDIARFTLKRLREAKLSNKIPCGVILTGGSAYLTNIDQLFSREMNMSVRCADTLYGVDDISKDNVLTTTQSIVVGIMLHGMQHTIGSEVSHTRQEVTAITPPPTQQTPPTPPIPPIHQAPPTPTPTPTPTPPTPPVKEKDSEPEVDSEPDDNGKPGKGNTTDTPPIKEPAPTGGKPGKGRTGINIGGKVMGWIDGISSTFDNLLGNGGNKKDYL